MTGKWILSAALVVLLAVPAALAALYKIQTRYGGCLNFRSKPTMHSKVMRCLSNGTSVKVVQRSSRGFVLVDVNGRRGFVASRYLATGSRHRPHAKPAPRKNPSAKSKVVKPNGNPKPLQTSPAIEFSPGAEERLSGDIEFPPPPSGAASQGSAVRESGRQ